MKWLVDSVDDIEESSHERGFIEFDKVVAAARHVDNSGALDTVADWRANDRAGRNAGGRPAWVNDRTILTLLCLLALEHNALHMTAARYIVTNRLRADSLRYLGLERLVAGSENNVYNGLTRAYQRLVKVVDPYPGQRRKRLSKDEYLEVLANQDPEMVALKEARLHEVCNGIVHSSLMKVPQHIAERFTGDYAIDGTFVRSGGKRGTDKRELKYVNSEVFGGRHFRAGNHSGKDLTMTEKKASKSVNGWGYELHVATWVDLNPRSAAAFPMLIAAVAWDAPAGAPGQNGVVAFTSIHERGLPVHFAIADRAYYAGADVDNFHREMLMLGYLPVTDYKRDQLGIKAHCKGAIQVEGWWYCPEMPTDLITAGVDHEAGTIDDETFYKKIAERVRYAAVRKSRPDKDGTSRWSHPLGTGDPVCDSSRPHAPAFCTQATISVPVNAGLKLAQELQYMSPEWRAVYPKRNVAESVNASMKRASTHNLGDPEGRRLRGRAAQFILATWVVHAVNIKKIRDFVKATSNGTTGLPARTGPIVPFGFQTMNEDERNAILSAQRPKALSA